MIEEAKLQETPAGLEPVNEGWFVVNVRDTKWVVSDQFGAGCSFESRQAFFKELGINICVLQPGEPACLYHEENAQEDFLVLSGECTVLVNGEERPLRTWDFFHSPPGTEHLLVGGGGGPLGAAGGRHAARVRAPALPGLGARGALRRRAPRRTRPTRGRRTPASSAPSRAGRTAGTRCPGRSVGQLAAAPSASSPTRTCSVRSRRKRPGSPAT